MNEDLPNLAKAKRTDSQKEAWKYVRESIKKKERAFLLWFGGVRAGKTYGGSQCFIEHARNRNGPSTYIIGGVSQTSVLNNVIPYFEEFVPEAKINRSATRPCVVAGDATFLVFGGSKADDFKRVQGLTADGAFLDEFSLLHRSFVKQVEARISKPNALRIYTSNKEAKYGWAKKEYFDCADAIGAKILDVSTFDNRFLDQEYLEEKKRDYQGADWDKFIENQFILEIPPIYDSPTYGTVANFKRMPDFCVIIREDSFMVQIPSWVEQGHYFAGEPVLDKEIIDAQFYMTNDPGIARKIRVLNRGVGCVARNPSCALETDIADLMDKGKIVLHAANQEHIETYNRSGTFTAEQSALQHSMNYYMRGTA